MVTLTDAGAQKVREYLVRLTARREAILDAGRDTAEVPLPNIEDVIDFGWKFSLR